MKKKGLLCEDADGLEVTDKDGTNKIVKTNDRNGAAKDMQERESGPKPTHESDRRKRVD